MTITVEKIARKDIDKMIDKLVDNLNNLTLEIAHLSHRVDLLAEVASGAAQGFEERMKKLERKLNQ